MQRRDRPDPATYIGKGKAEELRELSRGVDCDTVVFDDELTPAQQRNLEKLLGRTAIDRTAVILDIFAQNAHSQEGKAQVELAQLRYRLPRLRGKGTQPVSQQGGGIGTRGSAARPSSRSTAAASCAASTSSRPSCKRHRPRTATPSARPAAAAGSQPRRHRRLHQRRQVHAAQPAHRRRRAGRGPAVRHPRRHHPPPRSCPAARPCCSPTPSGSSRKLPHQLVEAFKSTLEVVAEADLLVHVVDASAPDPEAQIDAVREVLDEIGAGDGARAAGVQQGRPRRPTRPSALARPTTPARWRISAAHRRGHRRPARAPSATACAP